MTNLNLDVEVRLRDDVSRPAADAAKAIDRIGNAAQRLVKRTAALSERFAGLSRTARELSSASTALDRSEAGDAKLRGTIAGLGRASTVARGPVASLTRAVDRLGKSTTRAADAAGRLRSELERPIGDSCIDRTNTALKEQADLLRQNATLASRLTSAGGGGRRGMMGGPARSGGERMPGLAFAVQPHVADTLRNVYEQATSLQDAINKMRGLGMSDTEIAAVRQKSADIASANKSISPLDSMNSILEARVALSGDTKAAMRIAPDLAKFRQLLARYVSKETADGATDQLYDMARAGELRNEISDPTRFHKMMEQSLANAVYTNGRVMPRDTHKSIIYGRGAAQGWSDDFVNDRLPFFAQELKTGERGGQAGVALQGLFRAVALGVRKKANDKEWQRIGMMGMSGHIKDENLAISDPDKFLHEVQDHLVKSGTRGKEDQVKAYGRLFGAGTAQTASMIGAFQWDRLEAFVRSKHAVLSSDDLQGNADETLSQATANRAVATATLEGNLGSILTPAMTDYESAVTRATRALNLFVGFMGRNGSDPRHPGMGLAGLAPWAAGATWGIVSAAKRVPLLGRAMAGGAGAATTGGIWGASLEPAISGAFKNLARMIPGSLRAGIMTGLGKGAIAGIGEEIGERLIDATLAAVLHAPNLSPDGQKRFDANQDEWNRSWIWEKPGLIWKDAFGGRAGSATPISGARARGGPVGSGKTYLVGEHGPELFTPGASGAITPNNALGGDAREMRFVGFTLVSAIEGMSNRIIAALARYHGDGIGGGSGGAETGSGGYGGGSGHGDVSGPYGGHFGAGRRGFMERRGHFGGRRALMQRHEVGDAAGSGPRVMMGHMGSGGRGRYAKFDAKAPAIMGALMTKYGLTKEQAAGVIGNLGHESARFTAYHEGGQAPGRGGVGWAQWTGPRRRAFERWTKAHNLNPTSDEASWRYLTEGDPETAGAIRAVKRTHDERSAMMTFEQHFERAGVKAYDSREALARRALSMTPVAGMVDPSTAKPKAQVPDALHERARHAREKEAAAALAAKADSSKEPMVVHVTNHIHPAPGHDEKKIASMVHERFNDAIHSQLNDGAWS